VLLLGQKGEQVLKQDTKQTGSNCLANASVLYSHPYHTKQMVRGKKLAKEEV
jgi:hypothetical protein